MMPWLLVGDLVLSSYRAILLDGDMDVREVAAPAGETFAVNTVGVEVGTCASGDVRFTVVGQDARSGAWVSAFEADGGVFHFPEEGLTGVRVVMQQRRESSLSCTVTLRGWVSQAETQPTLWRNEELGQEYRHLGRLHCKMPDDSADLCQRVLGGDWRQMNRLLPASSEFWSDPTVVAAYRRLFESPLVEQFAVVQGRPTLFGHSFWMVLEGERAPLCVLPQDNFYLSDGQLSVNPIIADAIAAYSASYVCARRVQ